jgi:hypothetical protein
LLCLRFPPGLAWTSGVQHGVPEELGLGKDSDALALRQYHARVRVRW